MTFPRDTNENQPIRIGAFNPYDEQNLLEAARLGVTPESLAPTPPEGEPAEAQKPAPPAEAEPELNKPTVLRETSGGKLVTRTYDSSGGYKQQVLTPDQVKAQGGDPNARSSKVYDPTQKQFVKGSDAISESGIRFRDYGDYLNEISKLGYKFDGQKVPGMDKVLNEYREKAKLPPKVETVNKPPTTDEIVKSVRTSPQQGMEVPVGINSGSPDKIKLTPELLTLAETNPELFKILIDKGPDAFNEAVDKYNAKATKQNQLNKFISQQDKKRQAKLEKQVAPYKEAGGYNLADALNGGVSEVTLRALDFKEGDIKDAIDAAAFNKAKPEEQFRILQSRNLIPPDAKFEGKTKDGQISYSIPQPLQLRRLREPASVIESEVNWKKLTDANAYRYNPALVSGKATTSGIVTAENYQQMEKESELIFSLTFGAAPVLGTALYWQANLNQGKGYLNAINVGLDLLTFAPVGEAVKGVKGFLNIPGVEAAADAVKAFRSGTRDSLKALTNSTVVKAYDEMIKAGDKLAKNLAETKGWEKFNSSRIGGALREDLLTVELLKKEAPALKQAALNAGDKFVQSIRKTAVFDTLKTIGGEAPGFADEYGKQYIKDIENVVGRVYDKPGNVKQLKKELDVLVKDIKAAQTYGNEKKLVELIQKIPELKAKIKIAYAGEARDLYLNRLRVADRIGVIKDTLKEALPPVQRRKLNAELRVLSERLPKLEKQANEAAKLLALEWGEDIPRSAGKGGIQTLPKEPVTRLGGGLKTSLKTPVRNLSGYRLISLTIPTVTGPMRIVRAIPGDVPIPKIIEPEEPGIIKVLPQPVWQTAAPVKEPETIPAVPTKEPEKKPGRITETPPFVYIPKLQPQEEALVQEFIDTFVQPGLSTKQKQEIRSQLSQIVKTNSEPETFVNVAANTLPATIIKVKPITQTQQAAQTEQAAKTSQAVMPQSAEQTAMETKTKAATATETTRENETPKPKKGITLDKKQDKKEELTPEQIKSAIAWQQGVVIHVLVSPYRRGKDEHTYSLKNAPAGLRILNAKGKPQASIRIKGQLKRPVTVDVGNQDVIIKPSNRGRRATIQFRRDTKGTVSNLTISRKSGRQFITRAGGGNIISRRPLKAIRNV